MLPTLILAQSLMAEDAAVADTVEHRAIIIDLPRGKRLGIFTAASPVLIAAALKAPRCFLLARGNELRSATRI